MIRIDSWGLDLTPYLQVGSLNITRSIGNRRSASFTLVTDSSRMWLPQVGSDLKIYDDSTLLFGGVIRSYRFQAVADFMDTGRVFATFSSDGYDSIAYRRTVGATHWGAGHAGNVVRDMCSPTLLGADFVSAGEIADGALIKEYIVSAKSVKEVLDDMASASGGKWYINDNKQLCFYVDEPITYAPDIFTVSMKDVVVTQSLEDYVNTAHVLGGINDAGQRLLVSTKDDEAIANRKAAEGGSGVYGRVYSDDSIVTTDDALNFANHIFDQYGVVPTTLEFTTYNSGFNPGQVFNFYMPRFGINEWMLFLVESVTINDINHDTLSYRVKAVRRKSVETAVNKMNQDYIEYMDKLVKGVKKAGQSGVGAAVVEYKRAIWEASSTFVFSREYTIQPVVVAYVSFDYEGEPPTSGNIVGMYPRIELTTREAEGILYYTGAKVTWVGNVPPTLPDAFTNLIAVIGA